MREAGLTFQELDAVAVANRPGLLGALLVGVSAAKALAYALRVPLVAVHHIEAHIYANWLVDPGIEFPVVCLVASGGHSEIFLVRGHGDYQVLGRTRDDAAGEAFDKSARLLGLPYPGGVTIDRLAREGHGDPNAVPLPRASLGPDSLDFSFSGLKTAVLHATARSKAAKRHAARLGGVGAGGDHRAARDQDYSCGTTAQSQARPDGRRRRRQLPPARRDARRL